MNLLDQKLSLPIKAFLIIVSGIGSFLIALAVLLVEDSEAFQELKSAKIIDTLWATLSTATISVPFLIFAILVLSLFLNLFLFKRNRHHYQASVEFAKLLQKTIQQVADETGRKVEINFSGKKEITVSPKKET